MFKWFRREETPRRAVARKAAASAARTPGSAPVTARESLAKGAEVNEVDDDSAWDLWDQSQFQLDSQSGGLPSNSVQVRDEASSQPAELEVEAFRLVGKHHR